MTLLRFTLATTVGLLLLVGTAPEAWSQRDIRGNISNRAANRPSGNAGAARPAQRPNISSPNLNNRPAARPAQPASRPNVSRPNVSRPSTPPQINRPSTPQINRPSTPNVNRPTGGMNPSVNRPGNRPTTPNVSNRPSLPQRPSVDRPNINRPSINRPEINRPSVNRPEVSNRPNISNRPSIDRPNVSVPDLSNRPSTRPSLPTAERPGTRPSLPNVNRPDISRPGGDRPSIDRPSIDRPSIDRPNVSRPDISRPGTDRPSFDRPNISRPGGDRPGLERPGIGNRPGIDRPGISRPGGEGSRPRPTPGDIGDFLGMERPVRPENRPERPGFPGDRPGRPEFPGDRPGRPEFPGDRPGRPEFPGDRPGRPGGEGITRPDRPGFPGDRPGGGRPERPDWNRPDWNRPGDNRPGHRPDWIVNRPGGGNNNHIHNRPGWVNIDNSVNVNINNRWNTATHRHSSWRWSSNRAAFWTGWGLGVRHSWGWRHPHSHWHFNDVWWSRHRHVVGGWHYSSSFHVHPWRFWWSRPTWPVMQTWFVWAPTTPAVWQNPVQFDYGQGGNIFIQNNRVFLGEEEIATAAEFAMSAADLATVPPPATAEEAEAAEWLPLGTFLLSTSKEDVEPSKIVQLAVDRQGIVSGTLFNTLTDDAQTIQGRVDQQTQRVAFRIGESDKVVAETGLYNLTQDEVPVWVHFGPEHTEVYLLVRLEYDEETGEYFQP